MISGIDIFYIFNGKEYISVEQYDKEIKELEQKIERLKIDYQQANDIIVEQNKEIEELKKYKYRPSSKINFDKLMSARKEIERLKKELEEEKEEKDYYQAIVEHWE